MKNLRLAMNIEVKIILIYMISNIFLFGGTLQSINISCNKKASDSNPNILLIEGQYLALIASILISYVDFSRYNELNERYKKGEINSEKCKLLYYDGRRIEENGECAG